MKKGEESKRNDFPVFESRLQTKEGKNLVNYKGKYLSLSFDVLGKCTGRPALWGGAGFTHKERGLAVFKKSTSTCTLEHTFFSPVHLEAYLQKHFKDYCHQS